MTLVASRIRQALTDAKSQLAGCERAVASLEAQCQHCWSTPVYDPIVRAGYTSTSMSWHPGRGDERDHQVYVPEERTPRWARTCAECGKVETTTSTTEHVTKTPKFGG